MIYLVEAAQLFANKVRGELARLMKEHEILGTAACRLQRSERSSGALILCICGHKWLKVTDFVTGNILSFSLEM